MKKVFVFGLLLFTLLFIGGNPLYAALTPSTTYYITIQKVNSNGTVTDDSTTEAVTDTTGKLSFSLSSLPTHPGTNFIVFILKNEAGDTVRKGFVPAPPAGSTNLVGINALSTAQTNAVLAALELAATDDPIPVAYLLVLLRSPEATENDGRTLAALGKEAIMGDTGFEGFLTSNGVTTTQMSTFKSRLIYNPTAGKKTIADLTASFKRAVDSGDVATAAKEMQKAGGFMAEVFMDAAEAAGIDFTLILAAHDAAGDVAGNATNQARIQSLTSSVQKSMESSMSAFFMRIAAVKVKSEYARALNTLNASGDQVTRFQNAVDIMMAANAAIDEEFRDYYMNPDAYLAAHPGETQQSVQQAMGARYEASFQAFQTAIESTTADINEMKANVVAAFKVQNPGFNAGFLPGNFGTYTDFTGTQKNWPVPQVVMVNWLASIIAAGGDLDYTQETIAIPGMMVQWMGSCNNPNFWDKGSCEGNGGVWAPGRRTYNDTTPSPSPAFNYYMAIQDDIQIIECSRYSIYQNGQPTRDEEKQAKLLFQQRMDAAGDRITGTTNGTTAISDAQKDAIIKLLMQPSMD